MRLSYLSNGNSWIEKTTPLYWDGNHTLNSEVPLIFHPDWNGNVLILTTFSSLAPLKVTTFSVCNENDNILISVISVNILLENWQWYTKTPQHVLSLHSLIIYSSMMYRTHCPVRKYDREIVSAVCWVLLEVADIRMVSHPTSSTIPTEIQWII